MPRRANMSGLGDRTIMMSDLDGSLTGHADAVITKPGVYFTENNGVCAPLPGESNLQYCTGGAYARVIIKLRSRTIFQLLK